MWSVFDWEDVHCPPQYGTQKAHDSTCRMPTTKHQDRDHERLPSQNWLQADREEKFSQQQHLTTGGLRGQPSVPGGPRSHMVFNKFKYYRPSKWLPKWQNENKNNSLIKKKLWNKVHNISIKWKVWSEEPNRVKQTVTRYPVNKAEVMKSVLHFICNLLFVV